MRSKDRLERERRQQMTEQEYKEMTLALKHSEIPLGMQKEFLRLLDKEFVENEKVAPVQRKRGEINGSL